MNDNEPSGPMPVQMPLLNDSRADDIDDVRMLPSAKLAEAADNGSTDAVEAIRRMKIDNLYYDLINGLDDDEIELDM